MKHRLLLPTIVLLGCLAGTPSLRADDEAARKAAAAELVQTMHSERVFDHVIDQLSLSTDRFAPLGRTSATAEEQAAFRTSLHEQAKETLLQEVKWPELADALAALYAADFTEPELRQLIEFYKTPIGEKLLSKQTEIGTKSSQLTQQIVRAALPVLSQKLRASTLKFKDEHPPAIPASPLTSPATPLAPVPTATAPVAPLPTPAPPAAPPQR